MPAASSSPPWAATGLNHLTLHVTDLGRSWALWVEVFGARPLMRSPRSGYLLVGELWLCLIGGRPPTRGPLDAGETHLALSVSDAALAPLRARALAAGCRCYQDNRSEGASAYLRDWDGHQIELHVGDWRSRMAALRERGAPDLTLFAPPEETRGNAVEIIILAVDDPAAARRFYTAVLGWTVAVDAGVFVQLRQPRGPDVGLYARPGFGRNTGRAAAPTPPGATSAAELYVVVDGALDAAVARALAAGATLLSAPAPRPWGDTVAYLADLDGHVLALARPGAG